MKEHNLSIQDVVNATGISRPTISQLSSGKAKGIQFDTLNKLALGLQTDVYELFKTTYPSKDLLFDISWETADMESKDIQELIDEDIINNPYEVMFEARFFSEENINNDYSISSFRMPISVLLTSTSQSHTSFDLIVFSVLYETLPDYAINPIGELALKDYFASTSKDQLEIMLGAVSLECITLLNLKNKPSNAVFRSDVNNLMREEWSPNFSWDVDLISDTKKFENFINTKYGTGE